MTLISDLRRTGGALLLGTVLGGIAPLAGLFVGLAVFPPLGTLLLGPVLPVALLTATPVGMMSPAQFSLGVALSALAGAVLAFFIRRRLQQKRNKQ